MATTAVYGLQESLALSWIRLGCYHRVRILDPSAQCLSGRIYDRFFSFIFASAPWGNMYKFFFVNLLSETNLLIIFDLASSRLCRPCWKFTKVDLITAQYFALLPKPRIKGLAFI